MPSNAEIRDNVVIFKGPVTYDLQGIYVCDATNSIGTQSGSVEVSIIGKFDQQFETEFLFYLLTRDCSVALVVLL